MKGEVFQRARLISEKIEEQKMVQMEQELERGDVGISVIGFGGPWIACDASE